MCLGSTRDINSVKLKMGRSFTEEECVDLFVKDYIEHYRAMKRLYTGSFASGWQEAAIADFVFHKGAGAFSTSTLLKKLKANQHEEACQELLRWVYGRNRQGQKVVIKGLQNRAEKEWQWCMGEVPHEIQKLELSLGEYP